MKSYILRGIDDTLRERLIEAGVIFYDWTNDIVVEQEHYDLALATLEARGAERETEHENMVEVTLTFSAPAAPRVVAQSPPLASPFFSAEAIARLAAQPQPLEVSPVAPAPAPRTITKITPERAAARAEYIRACSDRIKEQLDLTAASFREKQGKLASAMAKYFALARHQYVSTGAADQSAQGLFHEEFQRLVQVPDIAAVRVTAGMIFLYTRMLHATSPTGEQHEIGKFLIIVRLDAQGDPVRWFNQTRQVAGLRPAMHAPYVFAEGTPCISEIQETLVQLIAQFEFAVVAELAIQFVQTVNDDVPGSFISRWPITRRHGQDNNT